MPEQAQGRLGGIASNRLRIAHHRESAQEFSLANIEPRSLSKAYRYRDATVFELTPTADGIWTEKVIHSFGNGNDGALPVAALAQDAAGNLYGTTAQGGTFSQQCYPSGCGTVFELVHKDGIWAEKVLHAFNSSDGSAGGWPYFRPG